MSDLKTSDMTLVMISPELVLPAGLEKGITPIDIPLPSAEELKHILIGLIKPLQEKEQISSLISEVRLLFP